MTYCLTIIHRDVTKGEKFFSGNYVLSVAKDGWVVEYIGKVKISALAKLVITNCKTVIVPDNDYETTRVKNNPLGAERS